VVAKTKYGTMMDMTLTDKIAERESARQDNDGQNLMRQENAGHVTHILLVLQNLTA